MNTPTYVNDVDAEVRIVSHTCHDCWVVFGLGAEFLRRRRADQRTFYCPNGHSAYYPAGRSEADRLRDQLDAARSVAQRERARRETAERSVAAYKGVVTRVKRRAAHGVCPCCTRSFADVARHMASKHPEFVTDHGSAP